MFMNMVKKLLKGLLTMLVATLSFWVLGTTLAWFISHDETPAGCELSEEVLLAKKRTVDRPSYLPQKKRIAEILKQHPDVHPRFSLEIHCEGSELKTHAERLAFYLGPYFNNRVKLIDEGVEKEKAAKSSATHVVRLRSNVQGACSGEECYSLKILDGASAAGVELRVESAGGRARAVGYGAYEALQQLGFSFLHPLEPIWPDTLQWTKLKKIGSKKDAPRWPIRGVHLHTQHPLELTDMLQGLGWDSSQDRAKWEVLLPEWEHYLDWLLANKQNRVEWVLLRATGDASFDEGVERQERLKHLVQLGKARGIQVGIDAPIRQHQQHAWRLIEAGGSEKEQFEEMYRRADYLAATGINFLSTENGTSEFTSDDARSMLKWLDRLTDYLAQKHGIDLEVKIHVSTGQHTSHFKDEDTGKDLNVNFIPKFADQRLGVMPHTVQLYALDDAAPTYGNANFNHIRAFIQQEAGRRRTLWYPETAYWVSYDIDVPLFLPLYAERRYHDLRLLAADEDEGRMGRGKHQGTSMDGQVIFSSGWEYGYWLNDVVAARAAWNPETEKPESEGYLELLEDAFVNLEAGGSLAHWVDGVSRHQKEALLSQHPVLNGMAQMQGVNSWDEIAEWVNDTTDLHFNEIKPRRSPFGSQKTDPRLRRLLGNLAFPPELNLPLPDGSAEGENKIFRELKRSAQLYNLRAEHQRALYSKGFDVAEGHRNKAHKVQSQLKQSYRVPSWRISAYRSNPSAYPFTYLWRADTLYHWKRDAYLARHAVGSRETKLIPEQLCFGNVIQPADIAYGKWHFIYPLTRALGRLMSWLPGLKPLGRCFDPPICEPLNPGLPAEYAWVDG